MEAIHHRMWRRIVLLGIIMPLTISAFAQSDTAWQSIFNGVSLEGWTQKGGEAKYYVSDSTIVGEAVRNTPNSFLCTKKDFNDFILEFEVKVDGPLNSGVQFRSNSFAAYRDYRVHGYQVEIDPEHPVQSGGIYDEARRGWLFDRANFEDPPTVFETGAWNKYRVEAIGDTLRTWVNGVPGVHVIDNMTDQGFIGLQVHGIGSDRSKEGIAVQWRNLRILTGEEARRRAQSIVIPPKIYRYNDLTSKEKKEGWTLLFDGQSTEKWRSPLADTFPDSKWFVHNANMTVLGKGKGSIVTQEKFGEFELKLDFRLSKGANSGIKYFVVENEGTAYGLEYQLLDDKRHPDADRGRNGNRRLAALYDILPARNTNPKPVGQWNTARIVARNNHVEHWLNGDKVLEYERGSESFRKMIEKSKYGNERFEVYGKRFGEAPEGRILLQDHGDRVSFRNIKIRKLN